MKMAVSNNIKQSAVDCSSTEAFDYYRYRLSKAVFCTINFRFCITMGMPNAKVVPVKSGEGRKFTSEGVVQVPRGTLMTSNRYFNNALVTYEPAARCDFDEASKQARVKLYFRGFPAGTPTEEITRFMEQFDQVEYFYLMGQPKSGKILGTIQGYVIFNKNETANYLLTNTTKIMYNKSTIAFQEYQANKKKQKCKKKTTLDQPKAKTDLIPSLSNARQQQQPQKADGKGQAFDLFRKSQAAKMLPSRFRADARQSPSPKSTKASVLATASKMLEESHAGKNLCFARHSVPLQHLRGDKNSLLCPSRQNNRH